MISSFVPQKDIRKIINYLTGLNLINEFDENPEEYNGMTWIIKIAYSDNREQTIYHFGNKFIRSENGSWFKMNYEEAEQFGMLLPINNE